VRDKDWQAEVELVRRRNAAARAVLGVSATAGDREVRRAFRRASLASHPDLNREDRDAARRFHLVCCAYRWLTRGEPCAALDEFAAELVAVHHGKYRIDNAWGYWCWWRETYFE